MKTSFQYRLTRLHAKLANVIEFRQPNQYPDKEPSTLAKVGSVAGKVAGAGALLGGAAYLRGRMAGSGSGVMGAVKAGVGGFRQDASAAVGAARGAGDFLSNEVNRIRGGRPRLTR
jgi:hypothetical protein